MRFFNKILIAISAFFFNFATWAEPVDISVPKNVVNKDIISDKVDGGELLGYEKELDFIKKSQRESLLLHQQIEIEKLRAELFRLREGHNVIIGVPYVVALHGVGKNRMAQVGINGLGEMKVQVGDIVPGGWKITEISDQDVTVQQSDGAFVTLPFFMKLKSNG